MKCQHCHEEYIADSLVASLAGGEYWQVVEKARDQHRTTCARYKKWLKKTGGSLSRLPLDNFYFRGVAWHVSLHETGEIVTWDELKKFSSERYLAAYLKRLMDKKIISNAGFDYEVIADAETLQVLCDLCSQAQKEAREARR